MLIIDMKRSLGKQNPHIIDGLFIYPEESSADAGEPGIGQAGQILGQEANVQPTLSAGYVDFRERLCSTVHQHLEAVLNQGER